MSISLFSIPSSSPIIPLRILQQASRFEKLRIKQSSEIHFIDYSKILFCEADSNYTIVHTIDGRKIVACISLCRILGALPKDNFTRIHSKYIINIQHLTAINTAAPRSVILQDDTELKISRGKYDNLKTLLNL